MPAGAMVKLPSRRIGWYGKLPARGDFVGRGLPSRFRGDWDAWLQRGLALAVGTLDRAALRARLESFAPWRYLARPAPGEIWCGIFVASHDRVGRAFPLTLAERLGTPSAPADCAGLLASLLDAAAESPEALEAAIAAIGPRSEPPAEPAEPWPQPSGSLWWPLHAEKDAIPRTAAWPPEPALVLELLGIQSPMHQIASAE